MSRIERERKYRLDEDEVPDLRRRLVAFGEWQSRGAEADVFFDHPRIRLAENDQRLRVRFHEEAAEHASTIAS
jgi:adenylate cyclase class IV